MESATPAHQPPPGSPVSDVDALRARAESAIVAALAAAGTLEDAIHRLLRRIGHEFGWETGAFWRLDPTGRHLTFGLGWSAVDGAFPTFWASGIKETFKPGVGLPGRVWQTGEVITVTNFANELTFPRAEAAAAEGLRSAVAFPVNGEHGELLGVLEFFTTRQLEATDTGVALTRVLAEQLPNAMRRIAAQERIRVSESRLAAMMQTALDAVVWMDENGLVTGWNPAAERIFGHAASAAIGRPLCDLIIPPALREAHRKGLAHYVATGKERYLNQRLHVPALHADGHEFPVELVITRIAGESPLQFAGFIRDLTAQKAADAERERLVLEAQRASELRDRLLAVVSHDLRNPLNAIVMSAEVLQEHLAQADATGTAPRAVGTILRAAAQMHHLIGDLLDVAVIQGGRLTIETRPEDLGVLVNETLEMHRPLAESKDIALRGEGLPENLWVECDRARLLQVFSNVLGNAIKFGRPGDRVTLSATISLEDVSFSVTDTGPGIPAVDLPHIFELHWSGRHPARGTGLGLFISRGIVEAHGGRLTAHSLEGHGSTFTFNLPRQLASATAQQ